MLEIYHQSFVIGNKALSLQTCREKVQEEANEIFRRLAGGARRRVREELLAVWPKTHGLGRELPKTQYFPMEMFKSGSVGIALGECDQLD